LPITCWLGCRLASGHTCPFDFEHNIIKWEVQAAIFWLNVGLVKERAHFKTMGIITATMAFHSLVNSYFISETHPGHKARVDCFFLICIDHFL